MKKLAEFAREETGEEWLREGYKVVSMRRNIMFRMLLESTRLLLFGNAGGAALIIGFMSTTAGSERRRPSTGSRWRRCMVFGIGTLTSALTMILVTMVSIKEAHGAESALKQFADGVSDRSHVMFNVEGQAWRLADWSTFTGIVSAGDLHRGRSCRNHAVGDFLLGVFLLLNLSSRSPTPIG